MTKLKRQKFAAGYALQVWLTSLLLGPFIAMLVTWKIPHSLNEFFESGAVLTFYVFFYSLPVFFMFWLGIRVIDRRGWTTIVKKLTFALIAVVLALILILVLCYWDDVAVDRSVMYLYGIYTLPLVAGVWVWRWPGRKAGLQ